MTPGAHKGGAAFGKYTLIAKLATGGMGEIFLARLSGVAGFEKLVVIKRLLPHLAEDAHFVAMLLDEARIAARLSHPNVCDVHELGAVDGQYFIAMEYLEGIPVSQVLQLARREGQALDVRMAAALLAQACEGLHHAHELKDRSGNPIGLVHRDVSPSNLFVTGAGVLKVLDFGVAKSQDALARTHTGALKGKFAYMSPEQVLTNPVDRRSDIFSLGIVFWELLTTRRLFWRDSEYKMFQAIVEDDIPSVLEYRPDVPESFAALVERALSRRPESRFGTAKEFGEAIQAACAEIGGLASSGTIADYVQQRFSGEIKERRELVLTAVSSTGGGVTVHERLRRVGTDLGQNEDFGAAGEPTTADGAVPRGAGPTGSLVADGLEDLSPRPTAAWKWVALALFASAALGAGAFAYSTTRPEQPAAPPIIVEGGMVEDDRGKVFEAVAEPPVARPGDGDESGDVEDVDGASRHARSDSGPRKTGQPGGDRSPGKKKRDPIADVLAPKIKKCLNQHTDAIDGSPRVVVSFTISGSGAPISPTLSSQKLADLPLGRCILGEVRRTRFDRRLAGKTATLPFRIVVRKH